MTKEDYEDYKRWMLSRNGYKPHPKGLDWEMLNRGQKGAIAKMLKQQGDQEYYEDAMQGIPH